METLMNITAIFFFGTLGLLFLIGCIATVLVGFDLLKDICKYRIIVKERRN
jgi:hypothetical protein|tara:strand:+ start:911 stop:1063 length:153 start_codon:yes stop_codon:yes gene_type:complete